MSHIIAHCKKIHFTTVKCSQFLLVSKVEILNYESGRSGRAAPCREKFWEKYESGKDVVNRVNILCQVQVAGKYSFEI